jgi:hypothetical protein
MNTTSPALAAGEGALITGCVYAAAVIIGASPEADVAASEATGTSSPEEPVPPPHAESTAAKIKVREISRGLEYVQGRCI